MLERITIRNYALVDEVTVTFGPGFNVLSGETGAGKSILIDALSLALGEKGRAEAIRDGAEEAEVTALLQVSSSPELAEWTGKYEIEPEDDTLLIRRTLKSNGRGSASVQAVPVTRAALSELSDALVDIHGQHEHQSLFRIATHRKLLDRFAGPDGVEGYRRDQAVHDQMAVFTMQGRSTFAAAGAAFLAGMIGFGGGVHGMFVPI